MKKLMFSFLIASLYACNPAPIVDKQDETLYDKTYLIFITDKVNSRGVESLRYELYKIDKSYDKFASGESGITANIIYLDSQEDREKEINKFKTKYPDSRIYVNHELWQ